jgi:HTH-type transcriptional regulator/antitoxin HigA
MIMATPKKQSKRKKTVQVLHPGEILRSKLAEKKITQKAFARLIDMQPPHVSGLINGKRHVSAMLALKLEKLLGVEAIAWMKWQMLYDLETARKNQRVRRRIK